MLPFAVKVVWFVLTILGTFISVLSIMALGTSVGCRWAALYYCLGLLIDQGMFCLGIIWRMDPYSMPRAFCLAQAILMNVGMYMIGGTCLAFCIATFLHVMKPKQWGDISRSFQWRPIYILPIIVFPLVSSAVRIVLLLKYDAVQPADGLHCDASHHILVRIAGYTFPTILLFPPSLYLSAASIRRVFRTLKHVERARRDENEVTRQMRRERHSEHHSFKQSGPMVSPGSGIPSSSRHRPLDPVKAEASRLSFHFPFLRQLQTISHTLTPPPSPGANLGPDDGRVSMASMTFPTFAPLDRKPSLFTGPPNENERNGITDVRGPWLDEDSCGPTSEGHETPEALELDVKSPEEHEEGTYRLSYREHAATPSRVSHLANIPIITPQIQRLVFCQV
ncbi:hypothetical protein B0H19DRAFT_1130982 [Mycena capillaripes]|nr:hypothetical protein B0H19DRAFT_1130982 [Mycena capillaripes]